MAALLGSRHSRSWYEVGVRSDARVYVLLGSELELWLPRGDLPLSRITNVLERSLTNQKIPDGRDGGAANDSLSGLISPPWRES